jgi:hypothetical protein
MEVTALCGPTKGVQHFDHHVIAERGVKYGRVITMPAPKHASRKRRRRQKEAQAEAQVGSSRRRARLQHRQSRRRIMTFYPGSKVGKVDPAVEAELDRLPMMRIVDLRNRYRELFRAEPPKAFGPDLLRRSIAHRIQERAYGGLSREHQQLLDQLVRAARAKPNGRLELPRRIKPGSELVRTWNRRTVKDEGK